MTLNVGRRSGTKVATRGSVKTGKDGFEDMSEFWGSGSDAGSRQASSANNQGRATRSASKAKRAVNGGGDRTRRGIRIRSPHPQCVRTRGRQTTAHAHTHRGYVLGTNARCIHARYGTILKE